jgi:hypothetical protein
LAGLLKKRVQNYTVFWFSQTVAHDFGPGSEAFQVILSGADGLQNDNVLNHCVAELFLENFQNMAFVQQEVIFHRRRLELNKQNLVFDIDFLGAFGNRAADQPFPGGYERGFIEFRFNAKCAQHLPDSVSDCLKFVGFFGHGVKVVNEPDPFERTAVI